MGFINGFLTQNVGLASLCDPRSAGVDGKVYIGDFAQLFELRDTINPFDINANGDTANADFTKDWFVDADFKLATIEGTNIDIVPMTNIVGSANSRDRFEHSLQIRMYGDEIAAVREQINRIASGRFFAIVVDGEVGEERTIRLYGATAGLTVQGGETNNMNDGEFGGTAIFTMASSEEFGQEAFYPSLFTIVGTTTIQEVIDALNGKVLP